MCSRCYRGHRYCSRECSSAGRHDSVSRARRRYAAPEHVRDRRRRAQRDAYARKKLSRISPDQTSSTPTEETKMLVTRGTQAPHAKADIHVDDLSSLRSPERVRDSPMWKATGPPSCTACGRRGTHVLAGSHRFLRR